MVTPTTVGVSGTDAGSTDTTALTWIHSGSRGTMGPHVGRNDAAGGPMVISVRNVIFS